MAKASPEEIEQAVHSVLARFPGMKLTVRQIYYQLVTKQVIENTLNEYKRFDRILVKLRKEQPKVDGQIEDRTRPRFGAVSSYWEGQPNYVEVWLEKDALSGVIKQKIDVFKCALQVTRGYPSLSVIRDLRDYVPQGSKLVLLCFSDWDPSGEDIFRHIQEEVGGAFEDVHIEKVALLKEDIEAYNLPPVPAKSSDSRYQKFVARHGSATVELDALPPPVLLQKVSDAILKWVDVDAQAEQRLEAFVQTKARGLVEEALKPLKQRLFTMAYRELVGSVNRDAALSQFKGALQEARELELVLPEDLSQHLLARLSEQLVGVGQSK